MSHFHQWKMTLQQGFQKRDNQTRPNGDSGTCNVEVLVHGRSNEEEEDAIEQFARSTALAKLAKEKKEEEYVQRLKSILNIEH